MGDYIEAVVLLFPPDAGGRLEPVSPRLGSYRPLIGSTRACFIEGPPVIEPGSGGLVVAQLESSVHEGFVVGSDLQIIEDGRVVGVLTVTRRFKIVA